MPFPYRKVLVLGATSGIGRALAARFVAEGSRVVVVGRRQDRLDDFVAQHGADKAAGLQFDLSRIPDLPAFAARVGAAHPDLDCVLVNQGVQRILDFSKPDTVAMDEVAAEMTVNYLSAVALTRAFLPLLQQKSAPTTLMYTSSGLALVPLSRVPNYCASKAALHAFIQCLRDQLSGSAVNVVELFPPLVQSELHDDQPGVSNGRSWGMPVDDYVEQTISGLKQGKLDVPVGTSVLSYDKVEGARSEARQGLLSALAKSS